MPKKRKVTLKRRGKAQLKSGTIYKLFAFGFIFSGIGLLASFTKAADPLVAINAKLEQNFGILSYLFPILLILLGFLFLRLKIFMSRAHVSIGFLLSFASLEGLMKTGFFGHKMLQSLSDILGSTLTEVIFLVGLFVGAVIFFDTSIDELFEGVKFVFRTINRFIPRQAFSGFKTNKLAVADKQLAIQPMKIRNGKATNETMPRRAMEPTIHKKDPPQRALIPNKLVSNLASNANW